jgi:uncharacterized protein YjdB
MRKLKLVLAFSLVLFLAFSSLPEVLMLTTQAASEVKPVTGVTLNMEKLTLQEGKKEKLKYTIIPSDASDKTVTFSSSAKDIASVDSNGNVMAKKAGTAVITVKTKDRNLKASCAVTVTAKPVAVSSVKLSPTNVSLNDGATKHLKATVSPNKATNKTLAWTSSNNAVAKVDANGLVSAVGYGTAIIRAKSSNGKTGECKITVTLPGNASLKKGMTTKQYAEAYAVAKGIVNEYKDKDIIEQLEGVALEVSIIHASGKYSMTAKHYNNVYGALVLKCSSCAGVTRAVGLCLTILGIPYEHVNENKYKHQWCRVYMKKYKEYWVVDGQVALVAPEPHPYDLFMKSNY